jgi:hypothetical protein
LIGAPVMIALNLSVVDEIAALLPNLL